MASVEYSAKNDHYIWIDKRPRDKHGVLAGYCSEMQSRIVRVNGKKVVGIASGAPGVHI